MGKTDLISYVSQNFPQYKAVQISHTDLVFEERVRMNCFYCGKWNANWRCPPRIPDIDFKKLFAEYENLALVYCRYPFTEETYNTVRSESTVMLHSTLLELEKYLWECNHPTAISFIGGSCKLCKNGCGKERCNNPYKARSPLEATGMNVVKTAAKAGIEIEFPPNGSIIRLGMIVW